MAKPAPRCDTTDKSDAMHVIKDIAGSIAANLDLTAISGKPKWGPQKTTLWSTALADIQLIDEKNVTHTIPVPVGGIVLTRPFITLIDSGAGAAINVAFEWFDPCGSTEWNF